MENQEVSLEDYFEKFRSNIVGDDYCFRSPFGKQRLLYADWIASGRLYAPIEDFIRDKIGPTFANTHSYSSESGKISSRYYREARECIKKHVNANQDDILITTGHGMTGALSKLQRLMGLKTLPLRETGREAQERPVVFITHMEHHSNQVSWLQLGAEVVIVPPGEHLEVSPQELEKALLPYQDRRIKIGAFSACSNVTGIQTPYHELSKVMHRYSGVCIVDFAASAPYVEIDMHPDEDAFLDAIVFSPHKFLGGPGSCGILVFNKRLYAAQSPDDPGGGNVRWTRPGGDFAYFKDIETVEDGGTPGILQVIRAALAIKLKEKMNPLHMKRREKELLNLCIKRLSAIPGLYLLGDQQSERIGCLSFGIEKVHYNLIVRLLNDRFGVQVRGGWSCASTYCHYLFNIDQQESAAIMASIENQDLTPKPGWVRVSLHPTLTDREARFTVRPWDQFRRISKTGRRITPTTKSLMNLTCYRKTSNSFSKKILPG